ncbi:MAG: helix-turn-helix domain-containing protein [Victivallales bacterium]|nr:helix-turn-helix domain-containing protein [Victivallales bacterium]
MDLFDKDKEAKEENDYIHEQLSLDLDISSDGALKPVKEDKVAKTEEARKKSKKKKKSSGDFEDGHLALGVGSFGKFLQDMRFKNDYSIAQVEQTTKIKAEYIELLEAEKLRLELPSVYILAYARKLCSCYKVPEHEIAAIINELKTKLDSSFSPDLIENINIDHEVDEDNQKKIRHFAWLLLGALVFSIALVGLAVFMLSAPSKAKTINDLTPTAAEKFDRERLKTIQAPIIIEATELPATTN